MLLAESNLQPFNSVLPISKVLNYSFIIKLTHIETDLNISVAAIVK